MVQGRRALGISGFVKLFSIRTQNKTDPQNYNPKADEQESYPQNGGIQEVRIHEGLPCQRRIGWQTLLLF